MTQDSKQVKSYKINYETVKELVSEYNRIKQSGEIRTFNEEKTKKDFILPLFEALGWNVYDKPNRGSSVSAEETISKKRVDYGFKINEIPKFYLEAKSLKEEDIQNNGKYVLQAIDYAWMKSCSWAILTNFETIAVYNADWKSPYYNGNLFFVLHPSDFLTDERLMWFSKNAFENNELDKQALKFGKKQFKNHIDKQLLEDMIHFREILSKDIMKNNQDKHLSQEDLDESVQRILDRLIFIRNAEDRELEENKLLSNVRQWSAKGKGELIKEISKVYSYYDDKYNSKLFSEHLCDDLYIDNEIMQEVIEGLNHSKDNSYRYDFSVIESDVLGNIYEQYLGNVLKTTPKRAKLESSKGHRKEQGIYYTPSYIVDYMVKNTVGEYIKTHTPEEIKHVKILDPACGSGSFIIRAYKELEKYWINNSDFAQLTLDSEEFYSKKVEILRNNIFGVDLDPKAVEIAQLNLLLQISESKQRLPILQNNIKVGNSLIDDPTISERAFRWEEEFPEIMKNGKFDIIIGNPPYGAELTDLQKNWFSKKYDFLRSNRNTALLFIAQSVNLLKSDGKFGMIVPKSLAFSQEWKSGRDFIKDSLVKVSDVSRAFEDVLLEQIIIFLRKKSSLPAYKLEDINTKQSIEVDKSYIDLTDSIILHGNRDDLEIFKKMNNSKKKLSDICLTSRGLPFQKYVTTNKTVYPVVRGKDVSRYHFKLSNSFLPENIVEQNLSRINLLKKPKIISQRIVAHVTKPQDHIIIMSALDRTGVLTLDTVENTIVTDNEYSPEFVLCLLNSDLVSWYAYRYIFSKAIRTMDLDNYYIGKIPLPAKKIDNSIFVELVRKIELVQDKLDNMSNEKTDLKHDKGKMLEELKNQINENIRKLYFE